MTLFWETTNPPKSCNRNRYKPFQVTVALAASLLILGSFPIKVHAEDLYNMVELDTPGQKAQKEAPKANPKSIKSEAKIKTRKAEPAPPMLEIESFGDEGTVPSASTKVSPGAADVSGPQLEMDDLQAVQTPTSTVTATGGAPLEAKAVVVDIVSDKLAYDTKQNIYTATGTVHVIVSEQNTELIGDKVIYDPNQELVIAEGNVVIINRGDKTYGTYAKIDLTRKSALINDPITRLDQVRVKAKQAFVDPDYVQLENGKLVIPAKPKSTPPEPYQYDEMSDVDLATMAVADPLLKKTDYHNKYLTQDEDMGWDEATTGWRSKFKFHADEVQIHRSQDGYDDINLVNPSYQFGKFKFARMNQMDFSHDGTTGDVEYLGPDIGIDPDYGGFYFGPGWDFRLGKGIAKFSPILSYGVGARRKRSGQDIESTSGVGAGAMFHYMSHTTQVNAGYNHKVGTPTLLATKKIFDGKTNLLLGANEDYNQGYLGWERPKYIAQITDSRKLFEKHNIRVNTFSSLGVARDEFFPTNDKDFFVQPDDLEATPVTAGRVQLQAQIRNIQPLLSLGSEHRHVNLGFSGQVALAGYTTGDLIGVFRTGPNMQVTLGDRFTSFTRYFYSQTAGDTPFVFDTYYRGRNSVLSVNQFRVNKYLTLGMRSNLSMNRDNAQNSLFTGNSIFMLVGPEDIKFNIAYDFIRQRSFFGINYMPGNKKKVINYDRLKLYQPEDFGDAPAPSQLPVNMVDGVQDVGMMNGNRAR